MSRIDSFLKAPNLSELAPSYPIGLISARLGVAIALVRGASTLTAQTLILAPISGQSEVVGDAGRSERLRCVLIGYRGVSGQTDFDVQPGDRFAYQGVTYRVMVVDKQIAGRTEAHCEGIA